MILLVFSVFDSKAEAFLEPFMMGTRGQAIRAFSDAVNKEGHEFNRHAADFTLFTVGSFDQASGALKGETPVSLGNALTFRVEASG